MDRDEILETNKKYWDSNADLWNRMDNRPARNLQKDCILSGERWHFYIQLASPIELLRGMVP